MGSIRERVSIQVSLVIAAVDDFTGRPVGRGQLRVWIDGERPPVAKEGGYYIFTNLRVTHPVIHLEGPVFHRQEIILEEGKRKRCEAGMLKVRMIPNRSYPVPRGTTCIQGHAVPGSTVLAYNKTLKEPLKLLYPYTAGQKEIRIFSPEEMDLEEKKFCIQNKEGTQQEILQIAGQPAAAAYKLHAPLTYSYRKIGTVIYPVYESKADQAGDFYLPVGGIYTDTAVFAFWLEGNEQGQKEMQLQSGKVNVLSDALCFSSRK